MSNCLRCDRPFIPGDPARKLAARSLDRECYDEARGCGELHLYPRVNRPWTDTAAEAEWMRAANPSLAWHSIAQALGIGYEALCRARRFAGCERPAHPAPRLDARVSRRFDLVDTDEL